MGVTSQQIAVGDVPALSLLTVQKLDEPQVIQEAIQALKFPLRVHPMTHRHRLQEEPYWEAYFPIVNFYALIADSKDLPPFLQRLITKFTGLCAPYVPQVDEVLAHLLLSESSVPPHKDPPVRDLGLNWYPFENHGHTLTVDGQTVSPVEGGLYLLDVRKTHSTVQTSKEPQMFFSYTVFL